jgi:hypothetical protein
VAKYDIRKQYLDEYVMAAYMFACGYLVPALEAFMIKLTVDWYKASAPRHAAIVGAFSCLPGKSPFLQLLVDASCINGDPEDYEPESSSDDSESESDGTALPISFLVRVAKKYAELARDTVKNMELRQSDYMNRADDADNLEYVDNVRRAKRQRTAR